MKRVFVLIYLFSSSILWCQGFSWELSPRFPFYIPRTYVGVEGFTSKNYLSGELTLLENLFICSKFDGGNGSAYYFGATIEHWYLHNVALHGYILFQGSNAKMISAGDTFPILVKGITKIARVENELSMNYKFINFGAGIKWRPLNSNLFVQGSLEFGFKLQSHFEIFEQVLSPPEFHFIDKTQRRKVWNGKLSDLSFFKIEPKICIGYDAPLFAGIYASPAITFGIPAFNFSKNETMRIFSVQVGLSLLIGIW